MSEQVSRRMFSNVSLASILAMVAASQSTASVAAFPGASSSRREVVKQTLPGDPPREITLVEVNYPPDTGSPPHQHANGVMAYVVAPYRRRSGLGSRPFSPLGRRRRCRHHRRDHSRRPPTAIRIGAACGAAGNLAGTGGPSLSCDCYLSLGARQSLSRQPGSPLGAPLWASMAAGRARNGAVLH